MLDAKEARGVTVFLVLFDLLASFCYALTFITSQLIESCLFAQVLRRAYFL